jgi:hypothetical protein
MNWWFDNDFERAADGARWAEEALDSLARIRHEMPDAQPQGVRWATSKC